MDSSDEICYVIMGEVTMLCFNAIHCKLLSS